MTEESGSAIDRLPDGARLVLGILALYLVMMVWPVYSCWLAVKRWYRNVR